MGKALEEIRNTIKDYNLTGTTSKVIIAVGVLRRMEISKNDALKVIEMCLDEEI